MNSDFNNALDDFHDTIHSFDMSNFTRKHIVPLNAQHVLARVLFVKIVHDMEVKFDMTTKRKQFLDVCKQHVLRIFYLQSILMD
jgi:hypothetical protein